MSTKCFQGVRFPVHRLGEFVRYVRPRLLAAVEAHLRKMAEDVNTKSPEYKKIASAHWARRERGPYKHTRDCWLCRSSLALSWVRDFIKSPRNGNPWFDMNFGFNIWFPRRSRYVLSLPYGTSVCDIDLPDWVEEYGYWDSTDRPDSIAPREWNRRSRVWGSVLRPNSQERKLVLVGFDASHKYSIDMSWLSLRLRGDWDAGDPFREESK